MRNKQLNRDELFLIKSIIVQYLRDSKLNIYRINIANGIIDDRAKEEIRFKEHVWDKELNKLDIIISKLEDNK